MNTDFFWDVDALCHVIIGSGVANNDIVAM